MIAGEHIPQNRHFILFQPERFGLRFGFATVLFKKTSQYLPGSSMVSVSKEKDDFILIDFFGDSRYSVHHS